MTNQEAIEMMKAKLECMTREVSGVDLNCNAKKCDECDLCYAQGNMGEQKDWLRMGIEALENQKTGHWINQHVIYTNATIDFKVCSECRYEFSYDAETGVSDANYCPNCGAKMEGE